jgi:hypothetical protein
VVQSAELVTRTTGNPSAHPPAQNPPAERLFRVTADPVRTYSASRPLPSRSFGHGRQCRDLLRRQRFADELHLSVGRRYLADELPEPHATGDIHPGTSEHRQVHRVANTPRLTSQRQLTPREQNLLTP